MSFWTVLSSLLAIVVSLAFVLGLAWGGLWLVRKFQDGSFGSLSGASEGRELRFERALPVGQSERLVLVEVDGEQMLLGVTAHSITLLKSWPRAGTTEATPSVTIKDDQAAGKADRFRLRMARDESK